MLPRRVDPSSAVSRGVVRRGPVRCHVRLALLLPASLAMGFSGSVAAAASDATSNPADAPVLYPASISDRKMLDQYGDVYLMRTFSSWSMASNLSDADITTALEGVAANGFNAVTVWIGGGYDIGSGWHRVHAMPLATTGGPARRGRRSSAPPGRRWTTSSRRPPGSGWRSISRSAAATAPRAPARTGKRRRTTQMHDVGVAVATRYPAYPNIVWHVMFDDTQDTGIDGRGSASRPCSTASTTPRVRRPARCAGWSPNNGASTDNQADHGDPPFERQPDVNGWYEYGSNSTEIAETGWAETDIVSGRRRRTALRRRSALRRRRRPAAPRTRLRHVPRGRRLHQLRPRGLVAVRRRPACTPKG